MGDDSTAVAEATARTGQSSEGDAWLALAAAREAAEAILVTDAEGIIRFWNRGAERMFGHTVAEAVGRNLDLIIPAKLRERHWKGYQQTMANGHTRYGDKLLSVPATHRDGRRLSIEFSVALLRDETGQIAGVSAVIREVTDRRNAERALRARLADLEWRSTQAPSA